VPLASTTAKIVLCQTLFLFTTNLRAVFSAMSVGELPDTDFSHAKWFWNASEWLLKFSRQAAAMQPESVSFSRSRGLRFAVKMLFPYGLTLLCQSFRHFSLIQLGPKIRGFC
jgi:hypothetical protein